MRSSWCRSYRFRLLLSAVFVLLAGDVVWADYHANRVAWSPKGDTSVEVCFQNRMPRGIEFTIEWWITEWTDDKKMYGQSRAITERKKVVSSNEWGCSQFDVYEALNSSGGYCKCVYVVWVNVKYYAASVSAWGGVGNNTIAVRVTPSEGPGRPAIKFESIDQRNWTP